MPSPAGFPVIALEEHFLDEEITAHFTGSDVLRLPPIQERLLDTGSHRLDEMDAAGIDMQVLSLGAPGTQKLPPDKAADITRAANDRLYEKIQKNPNRFAGFAALPTTDPDAAPNELDRAIKDLGFKGAMIHGLTDGAFIDGKEFWPIFERAEALDVPIYLHPAFPHAPVVDAYYQPYVKDYPLFPTAAWGFGVEIGTEAIRLVLSGAFDAYPKLKIILGHLGESLPFLLWRIDHTLSRAGNNPVKFREIFCRNFWLTTSGNFSDPALLCTIQELGVDRILFAIDWPFVVNTDGVDWLDNTSLSREDKAKIFHRNAERLLRM